MARGPPPHAADDDCAENGSAKRTAAGRSYATCGYWPAFALRSGFHHPWDHSFFFGPGAVGGCFRFAVGKIQAWNSGKGTLRHLYGAAAQSSQPHHPYRGAAQPVLGIHRTVCYTTLAWLRCTIREPGFAGILEPEFSKRCQGWYPLRAGAGLVRLERNGL